MLNHRWVQQINTCSAGEAQIFNFELFVLADIAASAHICGTKIFSPMMIFYWCVPLLADLNLTNIIYSAPKSQKVEILKSL